jgi:hypothetical protein
VKNTRLQKIIAASLLLASAALFFAGLTFKRRVYDQDDQFKQFGLLTFTRVSDAAMCADATFTGVVRKEGKLYSTYNRMAPRGKKACPT